MLAVQYDDDMLKSIDGALSAAAYMLRQAARIMEEGGEFTDPQKLCLFGVRDQMAVFLGRYDRGYWVPDSKLRLMKECEAKACELVGHDPAPEEAAA